MTNVIALLISVTHLQQVICLWPPPYKINLSHKEEFVIFETFGDDDGFGADDEMIKKVDVRSFNIDKDDAKYFRIHKRAMKHKNLTTTERTKDIKWAEQNYDKEERVPWIAGFFAKDVALRENSNVFYLNEMSKSLVDTKIDQKRQEEFLTSVKRKQKSLKAKEEAYDYYNLKGEYMADMSNAKSSNETLDFVDAKEDESLKESIENIINIKTGPRNCTKEEIKGIGLAAIECYWIELKNNNATTEAQRIKLGKGILKIVAVWFCLYLIIAIPCWCQKGWCCCCFQCRFCKPQLRIDEAKRYVADNPAGTYAEGEEVVTYRPSHYEKYAQRRLEQALMKL